MKARVERGLCPDWWVALALIGVVALVYAVSERIGVNGGFGWDGTEYGRWAEDFPRVIREGVESHRARRVLPAAVVYGGMGLLDVPRTATNIIRGFVVLDMIAVIVGLLAWRRASVAMGIGPSGRMFGMSALVVNFALLKWIPYNPVLTDASGLALGALMLACWTSRASVALIGVALLGALTWPTLLLPALLLIVFPRQAGPIAYDGSKIDRARRGRLGTFLAGMSALGVFGFLVFISACGRAAFATPATAEWVGGRLGLIRPLGLVTFVSAAVLGTGIFVFSRPLWEALVVHPFWRTFRVGLAGRVAAAVAVYIIAALVVASFTARHTLGPRDYFVAAGFTALRWPLVSVVAHGVFFGPLILLAALRWRAVCQAIESQGLGMIVCCLLGLILAIGSESRQVLPFFPMLVACTAKGFDELGLNWNRVRLLAFVALAVVFSKVWFPIGPFPEGPRGGVTAWATERLVMHIGPRMSWRMYVIQAIALAVTALGLWHALARFRPEVPREAE